MPTHQKSIHTLDNIHGIDLPMARLKSINVACGLRLPTLAPNVIVSRLQNEESGLVITITGLVHAWSDLQQRDT